MGSIPYIFFVRLLMCSKSSYMAWVLTPHAVSHFLLGAAEKVEGFGDCGCSHSHPHHNLPPLLFSSAPFSLFPLSPSLVSSTVPLLRTLQYLFDKEVPPTHPFVFIFGTNPGMAFVVLHTLCQQERVTFHLGLHWKEAEVHPEVLVSVW